VIKIHHIPSELLFAVSAWNVFEFLQVLQDFIFALLSFGDVVPFPSCVMFFVVSVLAGFAKV
jgi:hypothetical protein